MNIANMRYNKSLKAFAALTGTVQTGAASHYRAGSSCPLALRYVSGICNIIQMNHRMAIFNKVHLMIAS